MCAGLGNDAGVYGFLMAPCETKTVSYISPLAFFYAPLSLQRSELALLRNTARNIPTRSFVIYFTKRFVG